MENKVNATLTPGTNSVDPVLQSVDLPMDEIEIISIKDIIYPSSDEADFREVSLVGQFVEGENPEPQTGSSGNKPSSTIKDFIPPVIKEETNFLETDESYSTGQPEPAAVLQYSAAGSPGRIEVGDFEKSVAQSLYNKLQDKFNNFIKTTFPLPILINSVFHFKNPSALDKIREILARIDSFVSHGYQLEEETIINRIIFLIITRENHLALRFSGQACRDYPESGELHYLLGLCYYHQGQMADARQEAETALKFSEGDKIHYLLAISLNRLGEIHMAANQLELIFPRFTARSFLEFSLVVFRNCGRASMIEATLRSLYEIDQSPALLEKLAVFLYEQEEFRRAIPYLESFSATEPDRRILDYMIGISYGYSGALRAAAVSLQRFMRQKDSHVADLEDLLLQVEDAGLGDEKGIALLAELLFKQGDVDGVMQICLKRPQKNRIALILARCYLFLEKYNDARDLLLPLVIELDVLKPQYFLYYGMTLFHCDEMDDAVSALQKAYDGGDETGTAAFYLGEVTYGREDYRTSIDLFRRAVKDGYDLPLSLIRLAYAALKAEMNIVAGEAFRELVQIDPNCEEAHNNLGIIHARQDRFEEAIPFFKKVIEINPDNREAHYNLSLIYEKILKKKAAGHYERFMELENPEKRNSIG